MRRPTLFVEGCAGLAAVSLRLHGGRHARPPVSRMGNKAGYASSILRVLGLRPGQGADAYLWCEPDPGCRLLLEAYRDADLACGAAEVLRSWAGEEPRALWERLRAEGPPDAAAVCYLWQNSYRRGQPESGFDDGQGRTDPAHNRNSGRPDALAAVLDTLPSLPAAIAPDLRDLDPIPGAVLYLDPSYEGTTGYGADLPRAEVVEVARRWRAAGAVVAISEAVPLPSLLSDGWHAVEITGERIGQKRTFGPTAEWLTLSHPPAWTPPRPVSLFGALSV